MKVKNTSETLFRWQEFIWRPGEIIEMGDLPFEKTLTYQLTQTHKNLVIVKDEDEIKPTRAEILAKARAAKQQKREQERTTESNQTLGGMGSSETSRTSGDQNNSGDHS